MSKKISKIVYSIILGLAILMMNKSIVKATNQEDINMGEGIEFSNFSNAKLEVENSAVEKNLFNRQQLVISNYKLAIRDTLYKSDFFYIITQSPNAPEFDKNDTKISNRADQYKSITMKEDKTTILGFEEYTELKGDLYFWLVEKFKDENKETQVATAIKGKKIERLQNPKYAELFTISFFSNSYTQIIFNCPHNDKNQRKFQLKVGKINDENILKKIKNNTSDSWPSLTTYARSASSIYNKTLTTNGTSGCGYKEDKSIVSRDQLENEEYYYIYALLDDENGKYNPIEAVTISQASIYDNGSFYLFLLGSEDFKWEEFDENEEPDNKPTNQSTNEKEEKEPEESEEPEKPRVETTNANKADNTTAPNKIPQTGESVIIIVIGIITIFVGVISIKLYEKYNF